MGDSKNEVEDDDENRKDKSKNDEVIKGVSNTNDHNIVVKEDPVSQSHGRKVTIKEEFVSSNFKPEEDGKNNMGTTTENDQENGEVNEDGTQEEDEGFEMEIGSEIRFRVKLISFTEVRKTAKGIQAKTAHSMSNRNENDNNNKRSKEKGKSSVSFDLAKDESKADNDFSKEPATMQISASICEDGLGLTSWWTSEDVDQD